MGTMIYISTETLRRNSVNRRDIAILQSILAGRGFLGWDIDGVFGPVTERAVKAFQAKEGLIQDGVVGPLTWARLSDVQGDRGEDPFEGAVLQNPPRLSDSDYLEAASLLGIDVAIIKSVTEVESSGNGFLPSGRPKILFEGHVFWKELKKVGLDPSELQPGNEDILYEKWTRKHYVWGVGEYSRLKRAMAIHEIAALKSASWGLFQIMGFNHASCGFDNVYDFVTAMYKSEREHLLAFCNFLISTISYGKPLVQYLRDEDWSGFAIGYNGPEFVSNRYDTRLEAAYTKYQDGRGIES